MESKRKSLIAKREELAEGGNLTDELKELETEFGTFIPGSRYQCPNCANRHGSRQIRGILPERSQKAITILEDLKSTPGVNDFLLAQIKLQLADYYLMDGNIWDATLLYSQVDKAFKEEEIGEEAPFKMPGLSYFAGDFRMGPETV